MRWCSPGWSRALGRPLLFLGIVTLAFQLIVLVILGIVVLFIFFVFIVFLFLVFVFLVFVFLVVVRLVFFPCVRLRPVVGLGIVLVELFLVVRLLCLVVVLCLCADWCGPRPTTAATSLGLPKYPSRSA